MIKISSLKPFFGELKKFKNFSKKFQKSVDKQKSI